MESFLEFDQIYFDAQLLDGRTRMSFFTECVDNEESLSSLVEDQAIRWLFMNNIIKEIFVGKFFKNPKNIEIYFGLQEPFTIKNKIPGDIDILLVDTEFPEKPIAIECKRVKAIVINEEESKINNVNKIKHGVIQANKYQSLGFYKSFLMIIILDDGRKSEEKNVMLRSTKSIKLKQVYSMPWEEPLHEDVGIVFIRITQMTGKHYNLQAGFGICIDKEAKPIEQNQNMTEKISKLISFNQQ